MQHKEIWRPGCSPCDASHRRLQMSAMWGCTALCSTASTADSTLHTCATSPSLLPPPPAALAKTAVTHLHRLARDRHMMLTAHSMLCLHGARRPSAHSSTRLNKHRSTLQLQLIMSVQHLDAGANNRSLALHTAVARLVKAKSMLLIVRHANARLPCAHSMPEFLAS